MEKYIFSFAELHSGLSLAQFAASVPPSFNGSIKSYSPEEAVSVRIWDLKLNKPLLFEKTSTKDKSNTGRRFSIVYVLNADTFCFTRNRPGTKKYMFPAGMDTLFFSDDSRFDIEIPAEGSFKAIDISIDYNWCCEAFRDEGRGMLDFLSKLNNKKDPLFFIEASSAEEHRTLAELFVTGKSEAKGLLHIKASVLSLLSDFFNKIFRHWQNGIKDKKILTPAKMLEMEKILNEHIQSNLPGIDTLAQKMAMSESTLKRHFKQMFHKGIYEYYLEIKMNFAKNQLMEKTSSVSEVAAMLGYEKPSNFISIFKKHHGFSPGRLKRSA